MRSLFLLFLSIMLVLVCAGCDSNPVATTDTPQAGNWKTEFTVKSKGEEDYHWTITFTVNEDGETVSSTQMLYYQGELTPNTQASFCIYQSDLSLVKNFFEFSFSEWNGYIQYTYEGKATFTSATEAKGTINIHDKEYKWTAAPVSE